MNKTLIVMIEVEISCLNVLFKLAVRDKWWGLILLEIWSIKTSLISTQLQKVRDHPVLDGSKAEIPDCLDFHD